MQKIPVTRDGKRGSEIIVIDSDEVVRIDKHKEREYIVHTQKEQYFLDVSFESIEEWLFEDGFRMLDSSNIVNMYHVTEYDPKKGKVYLGDKRHKQTKTASAARIHKHHIENIMGMLKSDQIPTAKGLNDENSDDGLIEDSTPNDDQFLRSYSTIRAVNERKAAEEKIAHMAFHDALTDLPNRLLFNERLKEFLKSPEQNDKMAAVIFLDLDRFKIINDTLGHHIGDELLKFLGSKLRNYIREEDTVARFGGDEFLIFFSNVSHIDEITTFAKGIPKLFSQPFVYEGQDLFVTASIGISLYPHDGIDPETLIKHADTAMYLAKEKGGNTYQLYHSEMNHRSLEKLSLEISLRKAIEREEISVYYQPLVKLESGRIFGMEALVRWSHPERGTIPPGQFIPIAEETGLIVPIGNWVLEQACLQNKIWIEQGFGPLCVSVNISVIQFQQPGFVQFISETIRKIGLDPSLLCLEITENVAMKNVSYIIETMAKLKRLGVQISIDDFGTGYSSLSYLKRFHVNTLKIDQSFIKDLANDDDNAAIVTALIAMSQQLKIRSLAEGVETEEQLNFLRQQGCNEIQGYVFSRPLPTSEFESLLKENKCLYGSLEQL